jgi:hypothetical protein
MPKDTTKITPDYEETTPRKTAHDLDGLSIEPLMLKLRDIGTALDELLRLTHAKAEEVKALLTSTTLLNRDEAAARLSLSTSNLAREARKGAIQEIWIDRRPRYALQDMKDFIDARRTTRRNRLGSPRATPVKVSSEPSSSPPAPGGKDKQSVKASTRGRSGRGSI